MFQELYGNVLNLITTLASYVLNIFPRSPFRSVINSWNPGVRLSWLAWFFPVKDVLNVIALWLVAVSAYHVVSVIARWVKIIGD